jgi:hypothetical protein
MPQPPDRDDPAKKRTERPKVEPKAVRDEALREQSETETEKRPYLDTEGGE